MQCQILSVWLRYTCVHKSRFYLPNNCTHTHTPPFHHGSPDILFGLCKKKKTDLFNTAKIHVSAYNPTYLWRKLDTHVMEITCHLQSAYRGNSVRFCAEIQPEKACKSNKWQRVTCLSERIVGCWGGKEDRCSLPAYQDGNILTENDLHVSLGMHAWLTLCLLGTYFFLV